MRDLNLDHTAKECSESNCQFTHSKSKQKYKKSIDSVHNMMGLGICVIIHFSHFEVVCFYKHLSPPGGDLAIAVPRQCQCSQTNSHIVRGRWVDTCTQKQPLYDVENKHFWIAKSCSSEGSTCVSFSNRRPFSVTIGASTFKDNMHSIEVYC